MASQPDIVVEKQRKTAIVIEVAIPSDRKKDHEKLEKYQLKKDAVSW